LLPSIQWLFPVSRRARATGGCGSWASAARGEFAGVRIGAIMPPGVVSAVVRKCFRLNCRVTNGLSWNLVRAR
jgi:hypothetical protein